MKRLSIGFLICILLVVTFASYSSTSFAQDDSSRSTFSGACAELTQANPRSDDCDAEIAANPFPDLEVAVEYDAERDGEAHPRSIILPSESLPYPIGWQKRPWYFSDAPGILPADDDWTNERLISKYTMFYIYNAVEDANGDMWYLIESGQWMKDEFASVLQIPDRPEEVSGPWVALDLRNQTLVAIVDDIPVYATLISSGYWLDTIEGLFQVYARTRSMEMKGPPGANPPSYQFYTEWVMFFNEHEALHSADFHNYFGINRTHGCVNLAPGDAEWVWNFFEQNVEEWHPSGSSSFFVDNPEAAPWILVYESEKELTIPTW